METYLTAYLTALGHLSDPIVVVALIGGVLIGLVSGATPGGSLPVIVVLIGFAAFIDPYIGLAVAIASFAVVSTGDTLPAVMLGVPGSASGQATILDGHPLARQGKAGLALAASYTSSMLGGLIGVVAFLACLPFVKVILANFSSAEFFLLGIMGIAIVAVVSAGAVLKGLMAGTLALMVSLVGFDPVLGLERMTFGSPLLADGFSLIAVITGLFALPEMLGLMLSNTSVATSTSSEQLKAVTQQRGEGIRAALRHKWLITRSALIGFGIGALPGIGAVPAHWMAYAQARLTEKGGTRSFGTGDVRGVIAPESANNSVDAGVLLPTLALGIPGSAGMSIMLGFFVLIGLQPGAKMLDVDLHMTIFIMLVLAIANVLGTAIMLLFSPLIAKISIVRADVLVPIMLAILVLVTFTNAASLGDLVVMLAFGVLGTAMKKLGWPRPPFIIALVLSTQLEKYLWISVESYGSSMLLRPQFIALGLAMVLMGFLTLRVQRAAMAQQRTILASEIRGPRAADAIDD